MRVESGDTMSASELQLVFGDESLSGSADVIFVHGLDGDIFATWHPAGNPGAFWPKWLGEDLGTARIWSLGYPVASIKWRGSAMPLTDRATNALALLESSSIGSRPLFFVVHSLGGLLVKQMLRQANDLGRPAWTAIARQTTGIVFLSTPNSGSRIANWVLYAKGVLRTSVAVDELQDNDPRLRDLNLWFRNNVARLGIAIEVYCEKLKVGPLVVVDESSADPGITGVIPIPVDENHITICKPKNRKSLIYKGVRAFIENRLPTTRDSEPPRKMGSTSGNNAGLSTPMFLRIVGGWRANEINALAWSPNSQYLAAASDDRTVRVWNIGVREVSLSVIAHSESVRAVQWNSRGTLLACGSSDGTVSVSQFPSGQRVFSRNLSGDWIRSIAWSPDDMLLATACADRSIRLLSQVDGMESCRLLGHEGIVRSVIWLPGGESLVSSAMDGTIRVWRTDNGSEIGRVNMPGQTAALTLAISPMFNLLAVGCSDGRIHLCDLLTLRVMRSIAAHSDSVLTLDWHPDTKTLASGSSDRTLKIWQFPELNQRECLNSFRGSVRSLSFSNDGARIAAGGSDRTIRFWSCPDMDRLVELDPHTHWFRCAAWAEDGQQLAAGTKDRKVEIFNIQTSETRTVSPAGVDLGSSADGKEERVREKRRERVDEFVRSIEWAGIGGALAFGSDDGGLTIVSGYIGHQVFGKKTTSDKVSCVAWAPCGRKIAFSSRNLVSIWDLPEAQFHTYNDHSSAVTSVAWSPDSASLATAAEDGSFRIYSGNLRRDFAEDQGYATCIVWSPDSKYIVSGSEDGEVAVWAAAFGQKTKSLRFDKAIKCLAWYADERLMVGQIDGTVYLMDPVTWEKIGQTPPLPHSHVCLDIALRRGKIPESFSNPDLFLAEYDLSVIAIPEQSKTA